MLESVTTVLSALDVSRSELNINSAVIEVDPTKPNNHPILSVCFQCGSNYTVIDNFGKRFALWKEFACFCCVPASPIDNEVIFSIILFQHPNLLDSFRAMERAVLQNIYHPRQALYRDMVPIRGI